MTPRLFAVALALVAALSIMAGVLVGLDQHPPGTPETCARALGIHWTPEDGATERLNAYDACVGGELRP